MAKRQDRAAILLSDVLQKLELEEGIVVKRMTVSWVHADDFEDRRRVVEDVNIEAELI